MTCRRVQARNKGSRGTGSPGENRTKHRAAVLIHLTNKINNKMQHHGKFTKTQKKLPVPIKARLKQERTK